MANGPHTLTAVASDAAGHATTSSGVSVTVNNPSVPPVISGVTATVTSAGATISWTTDKASNSQVAYGTSRQVRFNECAAHGPGHVALRKSVGARTGDHVSLSGAVPGRTRKSGQFRGLHIHHDIGSASALADSRRRLGSERADERFNRDPECRRRRDSREGWWSTEQGR